MKECVIAKKVVTLQRIKAICFYIKIKKRIINDENLLPDCKSQTMKNRHSTTNRMLIII